MPGPGTPAAQGPRGATGAAASRPFGQSTERSFYCRSCQLSVRGRWVPVGWYVLERSAGGGARHLRVGLYCSLGCLAAASDELAAAEQDAGARRGLPADAARGRARLLETAQTLLHQGATIRAAGDELGLPTSALRHWLREAGVRVGADGTLTGSASPAPPWATDENTVHNDRDVGGHATAAGPAASAPAGGPVAPVPADVPSAPGGGAPVQALNELTQAGYVTDLAWEHAAEGPAHRPVFTCAVTARVTGVAGPVSARGTGGSKAAAKAFAVAALLAALAGDDPGAAAGAPEPGEGLRPGPRSGSQKLRGDG